MRGTARAASATGSARKRPAAKRKRREAFEDILWGLINSTEFRWDTTVDFAIGTIRPAEVAAILTRLIASAEGKSEREARADLASAAPRSAAALGQLFSIDSMRPTRLGDGSTAVTLVIGAGTGYSAAILRHIGLQVTALESSAARRTAARISTWVPQRQRCRANACRIVASSGAGFCRSRSRLR